MNENIVIPMGIKIGHYTDESAKTGCTVLVFEDGATCTVDVRGGAPGTRETDLLEPGNLVDQVHAILLSGGSAFGLDAATGVMQELESRGIGFMTPDAIVPIVPAAVIYDLSIGDSGIRPDAKAGRTATQNALDSKVKPELLGSIGAGTGATVAKMLGMEASTKSGIGSASVISGETEVFALVVVNAVGDIYDETNGRIIAMPKNPVSGESYPSEQLILNYNNPTPLQNTTIGVIATNARLTKAELKRLCIAGHDAYAQCIKPVHSLSDGDTVFAVSTAKTEDNLDKLMVMASKAVREAIKNSIR